MANNPIAPSIPGFDKDPESMFQALQAVVEILRANRMEGATTSVAESIAALEAPTTGVQEGLLTSNESKGDVIIPEGHTLIHPLLEILSEHRYLNNGTMICWGSLSISGDLDNLGDIYIPPLEPT